MFQDPSCWRPCLSSSQWIPSLNIVSDLEVRQGIVKFYWYIWHQTPRFPWFILFVFIDLTILYCPPTIILNLPLLMIIPPALRTIPCLLLVWNFAIPFISGVLFWNDMFFHQSWPIEDTAPWCWCSSHQHIPYYFDKQWVLQVVDELSLEEWVEMRHLNIARYRRVQAEGREEKQRLKSWGIS